ncbi:MAG: immunoglobulin-like domain-containing protein, partial [Sarcina sp.]
TPNNKPAETQPTGKKTIKYPSGGAVPTPAPTPTKTQPTTPTPAKTQPTKVTPAGKKDAPTVYKPVIEGHNLTLPFGSNFNESELGITATANNKEIPVTITGNVNTDKAGTYTFTATCTNDGITVTKEFTVTIKQAILQPPVIIANNVTIQQGQKFTDSMLGATVDEGATLSYNSSDVNTNVPGVYHVEITATNKQGAKTTQTFTVTVKAKELSAPVITGHNVTINVNHKFNESMLGVTATEGATITFNDSAVKTGTPGTYQVSVTATNSQGTTSTKDFTVTVKDEAPTLIVHNLTLAQGQAFNLGAIQYTAKSATGVNLKNEVKLVSNDVNINKPGTYTATLSVTDQYGETTTQTITVTVKEQMLPAPVITGENITIQTGSVFNDSLLNVSSTEGATLTYQGNVNTQTPGTYNVMVTATNSQGTTTTKTFTVTVETPQIPAPVITGKNVTITVGNKFEDSMIGATATVDHNQIPVTYSGSVNNDKPGTYEITATATNSQGKESSKTFTVTVKDTAPTLSVQNYTMEVGQSFSIGDVLLNAESASGNNLTGDASITSGNVNTEQAGTYTLTISVTDQYGETTSKQVTVTVNEPQVTITGKDITIQQGQSFNNSMLGVTANEGATLTYSGSVNTEQPGTYQVTVTATSNEGGGSTTKTFTVTVAPESAPVITGQNVNIEQGETFSNSMLQASATEGATLTYDTSSVNTSTAGTYTVSVTATNADGETSTKEFTVTVMAQPAPTITASNYTLQQGGTFNYSDLNASATEGATISYTGNVNVNKAGQYVITVTATNQYGTEATDEVTVTVTAQPAPVVTIQNPTITLQEGQTFSDSMIGATATEGATLSYSGNVNTQTPGTYTITVTATNSFGTESSPEAVTVTVEAPQAQWTWTNQAEGIGQYKGVTYYTEGSALQNLVNQDAFNLINQFRAQNGLAA